ncbi:SGNH/GDSL hydrolase family protein, partial [bacterium]
MRTAVALSLIVTTAALAQTNGPAPEPAVRAAIECAPRGGLPNVVARAKAGGPIRVAYLGGSITAAAGWRVWSRQHVQSQFPGVQVAEIRAAIPGTGAEFGAARLQRDVLDQKPDLIFVEFAVNGAGERRERAFESMEGIVRQARAANPDVDLCFVYTLHVPTLGDYQAGRVPWLVERMEQVADHYGIPSIHFGVDVAARVAAGTLVFKDAAGTDGDGKGKP